jgi:cohesin complex subunit SCC1
MKTQLSDTTDIVGVLELAPPTRRLMHLKETGGIEKLFSLSATSIYSKPLQQVKEKIDDFIYINICFY